jgi:hypothetical protein
MRWWLRNVSMGIWLHFQCIGEEPRDADMQFVIQASQGSGRGIVLRQCLPQIVLQLHNPSWFIICSQSLLKNLFGLWCLNATWTLRASEKGYSNVFSTVQIVVLHALTAAPLTANSPICTAPCLAPWATLWSENFIITDYIFPLHQRPMPVDMSIQINKQWGYWKLSPYGTEQWAKYAYTRIFPVRMSRFPGVSPCLHDWAYFKVYFGEVWKKSERYVFLLFTLKVGQNMKIWPFTHFFVTNGYNYMKTRYAYLNQKKKANLLMYLLGYLW